MNPGLALPAGYRLIAHETIDSTNEEARRLAGDGAPDGTVVWARQQTAGRGRRGRSWDSRPGNLYCSLILRPDRTAAEAAQLTFVAALALGEAVSALLPEGVTLRYKWPNDLLLEGRKVAGILLESAGAGGGPIDWLVVGCGLNIVYHPQLRDGYPATSLSAAGCPQVSADDMLGQFVRAFDRWCVRWRDEGIAVVRAAWIERAAGLGDEIEVRLPNESFRGKFSGLDDSGALLLDLPGGKRRAVSAGEVFF